MKILRVIPVVLIAFTLLACSFTINVPSVKTGETRQFDIDEAIPTGVSEGSVQIDMGAGSLNIQGGSKNLVSGNIRYNIAEWEPKISATSNGVRIYQQSTGSMSIPEGNVVNDWNLQLGTLPIRLQINAGAYKGTLDLGGCAISDLQISDGASKAEVTFSEPNLAKMNRLVYKTGASQVSLMNLANANVSEIDFEGGAGSYTFDFSGALTSDILVRISSGMSNVRIQLPSESHAQVTIKGGIGNVDASGSWDISGSTYKMGSSGPLITIEVDMAVGNLELRQQ